MSLPIEGYAREYGSAEEMRAAALARRKKLWMQPARHEPPPVVAKPVHEHVPAKRIPGLSPAGLVNQGSKWSQAEVDELRNLAADGATVLHIARVLKRPREAVKAKAQKLRIKLAKKSRKASEPAAALAHYRLSFERMPDSLSSAQKARRIVASVAAEAGLTPEAIFARVRLPAIVRARQAAIWLIAEELPNWSYPQIGRFFSMDHTTILHAVRLMNDERGENLRGAGGVTAARIEGKRAISQAARDAA